MMDGQVAKLVAARDIPDYPEELFDLSLSDNFYTVFRHDLWFQSETHLKSPLDVQAAALNLIFASRKQVPVGSLPDDDVMLAKIIHIDLEQWRELRGRRVNPLRNWCHYRFRDKIVLGHHFVIETALDAVRRRESRLVANNEKAAYQRLQRLRDTLAGMGVDKAVIADRALIERMDQWLLDNHQGQRRQPAYDRVLQVAAKERWF